MPYRVLHKAGTSHRDSFLRLLHSTDSNGCHIHTHIDGQQRGDMESWQLPTANGEVDLSVDSNWQGSTPTCSLRYPCISLCSNCATAISLGHLGSFPTQGSAVCFRPAFSGMSSHGSPRSGGSSAHCCSSFARSE